MKTIQQSHYRTWYIGHELTCNACGEVFTPESDDDVKARFKAVGEVVFECPGCGCPNWYWKAKGDDVVQSGILKAWPA